MLDINLIRENPDLVRTALKNRQMDASSIDDILRLDEQRRNLLTEAWRGPGLGRYTLGIGVIGLRSQSNTRGSIAYRYRLVTNRCAGIFCLVNGRYFFRGFKNTEKDKFGSMYRMSYELGVANQN